jgi:asparagine synthase (glutamine-hydrolysing)
MARRFFGRDLANHRDAGFAHATRWDTTSALKRFFSAPLRDAIDGHDAVAAFIATLPHGFERWPPLAQDQHIEIRTLLSGYLLSSQGDRMLMANSIEGRFPFLDPDVIALADSLPPNYKLRVLDEKHVVKRASRGLIAEAILARSKQPYRAPDALSFVGTDRPDYVDEVLCEASVGDAGLFDPAAVARLWKKCKAHADDGQLSNADNMAFVGILSTQLLHQQYVRTFASSARVIALSTDIDHTHTKTTAKPCTTPSRCSMTT